MAEVFEAYSVGDGGFRRRVALKRLLPTGGSGDPSALRTFLDEARICSVLHHRNIVSTLDFGIVDGSPFQVMEYVDGLDALAARSRLEQTGERFSEAVALYICRSVALALAHAHEIADASGPLGIVHRDVKPGNILLSWDGEVKLADFGIALGRERTEKTEAGLVKGTPSYMAPEQLAGLAVDGRADLFALGCVLHALLAGKSPLSSVSALDLLRGSVVSLDPAIPADIGEVIRTCLKAFPEARFESARAMADRLDELLKARSKQDARAELEALLRPLREPTAPAARRGKLDDLLDLAPVPAAADETKLATAAATKPDIVKVEPRRRGALWPIALAGLLVVGAGAWFGARTLAGPRGHDAGPASFPSASPAAAALAPPAVPADTPKSLASVGLTIASAQPAASPPSTTRSPLHTTGPGVRAAQARPSTSASATPATGTGFVAFRAVDGATRTTIVIDGTARGFAPRIVELPLGPHTVSFLDGSGGSFGSTSLVVRPENSREQPKAVDVTAAPANR